MRHAHTPRTWPHSFSRAILLTVICAIREGGSCAYDICQRIVTSALLPPSSSLYVLCAHQQTIPLSVDVLCTLPLMLIARCLRPPPLPPFCSSSFYYNRTQAGRPPLLQPCNNSVPFKDSVSHAMLLVGSSNFRFRIHLCLVHLYAQCHTMVP